jgi:hypothetical protein
MGDIIQLMGVPTGRSDRNGEQLRAQRRFTLTCGHPVEQGEIFYCGPCAASTCDPQCPGLVAALRGESTGG